VGTTCGWGRVKCVVSSERTGKCCGGKYDHGVASRFEKFKWGKGTRVASFIGKVVAISLLWGGNASPHLNSAKRGAKDGGMFPFT